MRGIKQKVLHSESESPKKSNSKWTSR